MGETSRARIASMEGPDGVKCELGFAVFWTGKMGFTVLGLGINHWERDRQFQKWEWDFSSLAVSDSIIRQNCSNEPISLIEK